MVVHHTGRCSASAETPLQVHDALHAKEGEGFVGTPSALRALLLLSGAVSPNDHALKRTSDADIAATTTVLALLAKTKTATHAA